jgi:hypothetical protein
VLEGVCMLLARRRAGPGPVEGTPEAVL